MKIIIVEDGKKRTVHIPTSVLMNSAVQEKASEADREKMKNISKALKKCKKAYPKLKLVEIEYGDGESIEIYI